MAKISFVSGINQTNCSGIDQTNRSTNYEFSVCKSTSFTSKVSPLKGHQSFGIKGKLAPRYVDPYRIIEKKGAVAYKLKLSAALEGDTRCVSCVPYEEVPPCSNRGSSVGNA